MKNIVWTGAVFLCAAIGVGAVVHTARSGSDDGVPADARREIKAANDAWIPALERQDAATVAEPYADDGMFVTATGATFTGRTGVEQLTRERFGTARVVGGTIVQDGVRMEGSLIYEWGHATLKVVSRDGAASESAGRYLTVWKRGADGHWRIWRNLSLVA